MKKKILIGVGIVVVLIIGIIIRNKIVNAKVNKEIIFIKTEGYKEEVDNKLEKEKLESTLKKLGYSVSAAEEEEEKSINNSEELTIKAVQVTKEIPSEKDKFPDDYEGPEAGTWLLSGVMDNSFNEINVSSTLTPQGKNSYEAVNLSDDNPQTAWVEGKKDDYGINETLELIGGGIRITIYNGYQRDYNSFYNNSRVKTFKVYFDNEPIGLVELFDSPGAQLIDLEKLDPNNISPEIIKLEIIEVYEGKKWDDTAISEIFYVGG